MHAGKVLAVGAPQELVRKRGSSSLEDAFISYLAEAAGIKLGEKVPPPEQGAATPSAEPTSHGTRRFDLGRLWAYARRETMELLRDPIRLAFAAFGPLILMIAFGYGISLDVENLRFGAFDQDRTPESRTLVEAFSSVPRYFDERSPPISSSEELDRRFRSGDLQVAVEVPSAFGRDLESGRVPEVAVWIDGSMPFRGETTKGYVTALATKYGQELAAQRAASSTAATAVNFETRFRYNQDFKSVNAMVPSVIMLMLMLIPAIMSTIGVVREKETGSIANFHSTPITKFEFLFGKQLPYIAVAMISFVLMVLLSVFLFDVPVKGSLAMLAVGTLLYVSASTGFGQLVSAFTRTQVAAVFATTVLAIIPAVNFSGLLVPVSSLSGGGRLSGLSFPPAWYQPISVGAFTKGLGFDELWFNLLMLAAFFVVYLVAAQLILRKQET
jgi:ribosome-dependent ATPase